MNRIIKFELKKILRSKLTIGALLLSFSLLIYSFVPKMSNHIFYDEGGNRFEKHQAVICEKELYNEIFNKVQTNSEIQGNIKKLNEHYMADKNKTGFEIDKALPQDIYYGFYKPREAYFRWIADNYDFGPYPDELAVKYDELNDFYAQRQESFQTWLGSMNHTDAEKDFWNQKANATKGPYQYGYFAGWHYFNESLDIVIILILAIGIAISSVYSSEHETGSDAVLLSSKYGRTKLVTGKIIASLIFSIVTVLLGILLCIIPILMFFGTEGWDLPIQVFDTQIFYGWNLMQTAGVRVFMTILSALVVTAIGLTLSSLIKKTTPVVVIIMVFYIGGLFIPVERGSKLFQTVTKFLPVFLGGRQYYGLVDYMAFGKVFTFFSMATLIYVLLILILLPISGMIFKKHQVK